MQEIKCIQSFHGDVQNRKWSGEIFQRPLLCFTFKVLALNFCTSCNHWTIYINIVFGERYLNLCRKFKPFYIYIPKMMNQPEKQHIFSVLTTFSMTPSTTTLASVIYCPAPQNYCYRYHCCCY